MLDPGGEGLADDVGAVAGGEDFFGGEATDRAGLGAVFHGLDAGAEDAADAREPGGVVDDLAARFAADCTLVRLGSPELVELAEAKLAGEHVGVEAVRAATQPLFDAPGGEQIDTVVLACTHFPLLENELRSAFPEVRYVDGGTGIARRIAHLTQGQPWPEEPGGGILIYTGEARRPLMSVLDRFGLTEVKTL